MSANSWFPGLWSALKPSRRSKKRKAAHRPLCLEVLEDRRVPSTFTVMDTSDSSSDTASLRYILGHVTAGSTIDFAPTVRNITLTSGTTLDVATNVNILNDQGVGPVTINGDALTTVFTIEGSTTATLSGLTITNGSASDGGGILNKGTLTVNNSTLTANISTVNGGAGIENHMGTLTVNNSLFSNNSATVSAEGGGIYNFFGTATVTNSTFVGNSAGSNGGAIASFGSLTLTNSTITGNSASNSGGVFNGPFASSATLNNDIVAGNSGGDFSGGNANPSSSFNLIGNSGSSGLGNSNGNQINVSLAALNLAPLGYYGGLTETLALLPGSLAIGNGLTATTAGTDQRGLARPINSPGDVGAFQSGTLLVNSTADSDGFGLLTLRDAVNIANNDTTTTAMPITFNSTVFASAQTITETNGTLILGTTTANTVAPITITGPSAGVTINGNLAFGVFAVNGNSTVTLSGLTITNGENFNGGGIYNNGTLTVINSSLIGNQGIEGGGFFNNATLSITNSTLDDNTAVVGGGGINNGTLTVTNSTVVGNAATGGSGGGLLNEGKLAVTNSTFVGNSATLGDAALDNEGTATLNGDILVGNSTIDIGGFAVSSSSSFNLIGTGGSGVGLTNGVNGNRLNVSLAALNLAPLGYYGGHTQTLALLPGSIAIGKGLTATTASTDQRGLARPINSPGDAGAFQSGPLVVNTTADSDGFGLLTLRDAVNIANADTTTTSVPITFNSAVFASSETITETNGTLTLGGSTSVTLAPVTITGPSAGVTISGNDSSTVFTVNGSTTATLSGLTITDGANANGGGINNYGTLTFYNSTLTGNGAIGGAGFDNGGTLSIINATIANNTAAFGGAGGLNNGTLTIINSTIANNTGDAGTGGITNDGVLTVNNSTFVGNSNVTDQFGGGGAIGNNNTLTVSNSTFVGNSAPNGGAIENSGTATLTSDILVGNSTTDLYGLNVTPASSFNLIGIGGSSVGLTNGVNGNQLNVSLAALNLAPLGNYGGPTQTFALLPGSLALGNGVTETTATTDQRGFARPINSPSDVGAFEAQPVATANSVGPLIAGNSFTGTLATFTDADPSAPASSYTAIINWGDGSGDTTVTTAASASGQIVANSGGGFNVVGTHTYATVGVDTVTLTIADQQGNSRVVSLVVQVQNAPTTTVTSPPTPSSNGNTGMGNSTSTVPVQVKAPQTVGVFNPATATWYLNGTNSSGAPTAGQFQYGAPGWIALTGDFTGDGQNTVVVVDPTTETWYIRNSNSSGAPSITPFQFGAPGWIPVIGDWNGSGVDGIGVVDPTTGTWYLRNEANSGAPDAGVFSFGEAGWIPLVGNWAGNANGQDGIGMLNPTTETWYLRNTPNAGGVSYTPFSYGAPGWTPVVGAWTGNGQTGIGVYDPTGTFYLRNELSGGAPDAGKFSFGVGGWTPLAGQWQKLSNSGQAQFAAGVGPGAASLSNAALQTTVQEALALLRADGVAPALVQELASATYTVAELPPGLLGETFVQTNTVEISADASGYGWYTDTTADDPAFAANGSAPVGSPAANHEDLLTTVLHEMGHLAGQPDVANALTSDLMDAMLPLGTRRIDALDLVFASGIFA